jgi:hypothetical protein
MREDLGNHGRMFDGGDDRQGTAALRTLRDVVGALFGMSPERWRSLSPILSFKKRWKIPRAVYDTDVARYVFTFPLRPL